MYLQLAPYNFIFLIPYQICYSKCQTGLSSMKGSDDQPLSAKGLTMAPGGVVFVNLEDVDKRVYAIAVSGACSHFIVQEICCDRNDHAKGC